VRLIVTEENPPDTSSSAAPKTCGLGASVRHSPAGDVTEVAMASAPLLQSHRLLMSTATEATSRTLPAELSQYAVRNVEAFMALDERDRGVTFLLTVRG